MKKTKNFQFIKRYLPATLVSVARALRGDFNFIGNKQSCPFCASDQFLWCGMPPAISLECKSCGSNSRERLLLWVLKHKSLLIAEPILHFAAERNLEKFMRHNFPRYNTADKYLAADFRLDIERIELGDNSQATVIVSHVLDLTDISASLGELSRILQKGGNAIIIVDQSDSQPKSLRIGNPDQWQTLTLRRYDEQKFIVGDDFQDKLTTYFSSVAVLRPPKEVAVSIAIFPTEAVFIASK